MLPAEIRNQVPQPSVVLFGCTAFVPHPAGEICPACRNLIGFTRQAERDRVTYCARCESFSPDNEDRLRAQRVNAVNREPAIEAERELVAELRRQRPLTERQRRRIWFGASQQGYDRGKPAVVNRAHVGRAWLASIDQLPDWTLILDARGKVVGRTEAPIADACPDAA